MPTTGSPIDTARAWAADLTTVDAVIIGVVLPYVALYVAMPLAVGGLSYWWSWAMLVVIGWAGMVMGRIGQSA